MPKTVVRKKVDITTVIEFDRADVIAALMVAYPELLQGSEGQGVRVYSEGYSTVIDLDDETPLIVTFSTHEEQES